MNIIGIHGSLKELDPGAIHFPNDYKRMDEHDSGATLFVDGKHIRSIDEERLSKRKYDGRFPYKSIDYCLGDLTKEDVDIVCYTPSGCDECNRQLIHKLASKRLRGLFPNAKVWFVGHHLAHAASAVFTAPFNSGSFLTLDGMGSSMWNFNLGNVPQGELNSIGYFDKNKRQFRFFRMPDWGGHSGTNVFGQFYGATSTHIQEDIYSDEPDKVGDDFLHSEGKVMGLSAYGNDFEYNFPQFCTEDSRPYAASPKDALKVFDIDQYEMGLPYINFHPTGGIVHNIVSAKISPADKSYFVQKHYEDALTYLIKELRDDYLTEDICFAGGCFLNISANTLLKPLFNNIHIPPNTTDSGVHFGAAVWASYRSKEEIEIPHNIALLGKSYNDKEIEEAIGFKDLKNIGEIKYNKYKDFDELCEIVAKYLEDDKIVGWFQGRSESGPRALGSRSLLMSPHKEENKDIMNKRVKHREYWRPFAGITLEGNGYDDSPYMLFNHKILTDDIPAITHVDGTCRMQTVNDDLNPKMCSLLRKLKNPILLNTSFNDNGEPIVETPEDAINSFKKMDIDYLVIGNYIIS
tara:strand:- start:368 stop:2095 length:1728 start_codon:yes stop_codon:yes gene_type:complete